MKIKQNILSRFLQLFIIVIVIPVFLINFILNQKYREVLKTNCLDRVKQVVEQAATTYEQEQKQLGLVTTQIANEYILLDLMNRWHTEQDRNKAFKISKEIDSRLGHIFNHNNDSQQLVIFYKDGSHYYYGNPINLKEDVRKSSWYQKTLIKNGDVLRHGLTQGLVTSPNKQKKIAASITPRRHQNIDSIELIYYEIKSNAFSTFNPLYYSFEMGEILILNKEGKKILSSYSGDQDNDTHYSVDYSEYLQQNKSRELQTFYKKNHIISTYYLPKTNETILNVMDKNNLNKDLSGILYFFNLCYLVILLLFIVFIILFLNQIINPIKKLIEQMKTVKKNSFDISSEVEYHTEIKGPTEIILLNESYIQMMDRIKELIRERDIKEKEKNKEEMRALQAQINPHFIYNTLNSIKLMAMMSKADGIKNMLSAFMKILSKTFKDVGKKVLIEEEIDYICNYLYIMKVRYGNEIELHIDIEEDIKKCYILNMLLQPIVENAIIHGLSIETQNPRISLCGYSQENSIVLEVKDNGCGMSQMEINNLLLHDKPHAKGFNQMGISNVNRRIQLNFGNEYGIDIVSEPNLFTTVKVKLPKCSEEEENKGV